MKRKRVTMDFETRSTVNLKTAGAYKYSLDPSTRPTCLGFKIHGEPTVYFLPFDVIERPWKKLPPQLHEIWLECLLGGYEFSAHNAFFETCIYKHVLVKRLGWPDIPFKQFRCTAAKAAACALPRNLEGAGLAMRLKTQKDPRGHAAVMATCKPTRQWKNWNEKFLKGKAASWEEPVMFRTPETDPEVFKVLYQYCKIDVIAEELLDDSLPDLLPQEQQIWFLNQQLNWRGLRVDIPVIDKIVGMMAVESKKRLKELDTLTMGLITKAGARKSILDFLALEGIVLPDLKAKTVDDALKGEALPEDMKALLEIRKALSKTSTKKYQAFLQRATDDRVRDILLYHGASTGRDTGTGIQPHNFPRGLIKVERDRPYAAVQDVAECDHEMLKILYGDSLAVLFSSILRNMIIPTEGHELFVADFSKIEVAVLGW
jgi:DNA polymerase